MKNEVGAFLRAQWREWRATVCAVVFVIVPLKSSFADWNWVPSGSMNPTIVEGDMVYVNKVAYDLRFPLTLFRLARWADPRKGEIVVLFSPTDGTRLVKRVIGVPGDEIEMRDNRLYINGKALRYEALPDEATGGMMDTIKSRAVFAQEDLLGAKHAVMAIPSVSGAPRNFDRQVVPEGKYFVMGDNRDMSLDSRQFGFADREQIIGRAAAVIVSFNMLDFYQPRLSRFFSALD